MNRKKVVLIGVICFMAGLTLQTATMYYASETLHGAGLTVQAFQAMDMGQMYIQVYGKILTDSDEPIMLNIYQDGKVIYSVEASKVSGTFAWDGPVDGKSPLRVDASYGNTRAHTVANYYTP